MLKKLTNEFKRFLRDDRGAEGMEKLLLIGALIIPLLGILIYFKTEITTWVNDIWGTVREDHTTYEYDGSTGN